MMWYYKTLFRITGRGNPLATNEFLSQGLSDAVFAIFVVIQNTPFRNKLFCGELNV